MAKRTTDPWYKNLFEKVSKDPADHPWYTIVDGRLYVSRSDPSLENLMEDQDAWKLLIPKEQRQTVLSEWHEEPAAGHLGRRKTYERVATYYYWLTIYHGVAYYVKTCEICQQCKVSQLAPARLMAK